MEQPYPLRTCIINHNLVDTRALRSNILQYPGLFSLCQVTGDIRDSYQILSAENFDVTICNDKTIPVDTIFSIGQRRFGILVFLDKDASIKANNHPHAQGKSFYIRPPYKASLAQLIGSITTEFAERKLIEQLTRQFIKKPLVIRSEAKQLVIRQEQVLYVRSEGGYCNVAFVDLSGPREISLRATLPYFLEKLDASFFFQADRNYLVNLLYLREIDKAINIIALYSEHGKWKAKIPISEKRLTELRRLRPDFFS